MTQAEIQSKLDVLKENLRKLDLLPHATFEEFHSDFRNVATALYLLQTSVQALVDLAAWASASRALPVARTIPGVSGSWRWRDGSQGIAHSRGCHDEVDDQPFVDLQ